MTRRRTSTEFIHEGNYAVAVTIDLEYSDESWPPTTSWQDAQKLESTRLALRAGDLAAAAKHGKVYELKPVTVMAAE